MAYKYKNVINLQGPEAVIQMALFDIQHLEYGIGSIDFDAITPMPRWVVAGGDTLCESWCMEHWGVTENASELTTLRLALLRTRSLALRIWFVVRLPGVAAM